MTQELIEHFADGIATLTMNRPEARNALTPEMHTALAEALPRLAQDPAVRVVVLTGAGAAFCSGGDVKRFAQAARSNSAPMAFEQRVTDLRRRMAVSEWLHTMPKPTLAVIPGAAAGAGLAMALACDLRIASTQARLTTAFANVGLAGDFGGSYFLTHLVGTARARELYFTARVVASDEALAIGMVDRLAAPEELQDAALALARELASAPTIALGHMKQNLNTALSGTLAQTLDSEALRMIRTFETEDHRHAAQAFVEKRKPRFEGR